MESSLSYPIGKYIPNRSPNPNKLQQWIKDISTFPSEVEKLANGLSAVELNWKYRPKGWSLKQVIHHCADSHINSIMRFKLCLTEDKPSIRPYFEDRWAELADSKDDNVNASIQLLKGLHHRWTLLLESLSKEDLEKEFMHPEHGKTFNIAETIGNYAWHCNHHLMHMKNALASKGRYN